MYMSQQSDKNKHIVNDWQYAAVKDQQNKNSQFEEGTEDDLYEVVVHKLSDILTSEENSNEDLKGRKSKNAPRVLMWNGTRKRKPFLKMRHPPLWPLRPKVGTAEDTDSDLESDTTNVLSKYSSLKDMMKAYNMWKDEYDIEINDSLKPTWLGRFKEYFSSLGRQVNDVIAPDDNLKTKNFEKCQNITNLPLHKEAKTSLFFSEMLNNCKMEQENEAKTGVDLNVADTPDSVDEVIDNNTYILIEDDENLM